MVDILEALRAHADSVTRYGPARLSEHETRALLIDPVLRLLGYTRIEDIRMEVPVPSTKEFLDYQLKVDGEPRVIVEAKALRQDLTDKHAGQCVAYASVLGVPWCVITNGETWLIYYAHARGALEEKRVAAVRLGGTDEDLARAWAYLSTLSLESLRTAAPAAALMVDRVVQDELAHPDSSAVAALRKSIRSRFGVSVPGHVVVERIQRAGLSGGASFESRPEEHVPIGSPSTARRMATPQRPSVLVRLVEAGLLASDAALECRVYGVTHAARLRDGRIELAGKQYDSPSAAASALRNGKASNGWVMWSYRGRLLADWRKDLEMGTAIMNDGAATQA